MIILTNDISDIFLNIPRLYTSMAQWLAVIVFIIFAPRRFNKASTGIISAFFFVGMLLFHLWASTWPISIWILGMVTTVLIMFLFIKVVTNFNFLVSGYITAIAFILSEFVASFAWQLEYFWLSNGPENGFFRKIFLATPLSNFHLRFTPLMIIIFFALFSLVFLFERRYQKSRSTYNIKTNDFVSVLVIGILIFAISNFSFLGLDSPISSESPMEIFYIRTLVDLVGVVIMLSQREYNYGLQKNLEVTLMKNMLDKQYDHFKASLASIDAINRKYHDLKHQLEVIRNEIDFDKKNQHLIDLEHSIKNLEATYDTGNRIIDSILNIKDQAFRENEIDFSYVANAEKLTFISLVDLVSIFSNAIDNAIEGTKEIKDISKRVIRLTINPHSNFILIKLENYYENILRFDKGNLVTTKGDDLFHGYGIRSIKHAVKKYQGNLKIDTTNNWFSLIIMFPIFIDKK